MAKILSNLMLSISIFLAILIIYYLKRLETIKCDCALNFKRKYILGFTSLSLLLSISNFLFKGYKIYIKFLLLIYVPWIIATITNVIYTIQYVSELKKTKCECSESVYREIMFILAILNSITISLAVLIIIFIFVQSPDMFSKSFFQKVYKKMLKNKI
uniref:Uncharacterized protein n=1 Tax=viral metagenome TaxID=1070528 RepID=A0A6C0JLT4_9ZZZZ